MPRKPKLTLVSPTNDGTPMPPELGDDGAALWRRILAEYQIADCGSLELLAQICHAQDMISRCRAAIDRDGVIIKSKSSMREHPALRSELNYRAFVVRGLQKLGITLEPVKSVGRPTGYGTL